MNLHRHAADVMHLFGPGRNPATDTVPGLPRVAGHRNPQLGATVTQLNPAKRGPFVDVIGQPSMKLVPGGKGSVLTILERRSRYADLISDEDMKPLYQLMADVEAEAKRLSQGSVSLRELRRRGHPYGRGLTASGSKRGTIPRSGRRGVANLAVINKQSGNLAGSWDNSVQRYKAGVRLILRNTAEYSIYVALGTRRMRAHGPNTAAVVKYLPAIDRHWRAAAKRAYLREVAMEGLF